MAASDEKQVARHRMVLFCIGGIAALALWALAENWDNLALPPPLYLALFTFVATYSSVTLALAGPVNVAQALKGALLVAVPVTLLVSLAGLRHVVATDLLDDPVLLSVITVLVVFSTPFLLVWLQSPSQWRDYASLFDAAWTIAVRYIVAWVFVGVFWLVIFLSNALFGLVGIEIIKQMLDTDWAPFGLTGAMLGLGLAVVYELRNTISPYLILRLLRLLVPVVLVVLTVFLIGVPIRGLSDLFGEFSAAATLMGAAIVAISLISTALDRDDTRAVHTKGLRIATRLLALLLPLLALLAVWAVVLRVRQYGWTPDRVLAASIAVFVLAYGLGYAVAVARGNGWGARVRNVNVVMALAIIVVSALWTTPVLNPLRIATNSQISRFEAGTSTLDQLPFWSLEHDWGTAGQAALQRLAGQTERQDHAELAGRIDTLHGQTSKYQFNRAVAANQAPGDAEILALLLPVRPQGASLPAEVLATAPHYQLSQWLEACRRSLPDRRPGCVLIMGAFKPGAQVQGMLLYLNEAGRTRAEYLRQMENGDIGFWSVSQRALPGDLVARALDGTYEIRPSGAQALFIGDAVLEPEN